MSIIIDQGEVVFNKYYTFEPRKCFTDENGTFRPFYLDNDLVFCLNLGISLGTNTDLQNQQLKSFCEVLSKKINRTVTTEELVKFINSRKIEK